MGFKTGLLIGGLAVAVIATVTGASGCTTEDPEDLRQQGYRAGFKAGRDAGLRAGEKMARRGNLQSVAGAYDDGYRDGGKEAMGLFGDFDGQSAAVI